MSASNDYVVIREADGTFRLVRITPPHPGPVARVQRVLDRRGQPMGWRLKPLVTLRGAESRVWTSAADAIAATKLMTLAQARKAVTAVAAPASSPDGETNT